MLDAVQCRFLDCFVIFCCEYAIQQNHINANNIVFFFIFILAANVDKHIFLKKNYSFYYAFAVSNHNSVDRRKAVVFSFFSPEFSAFFKW